ncbi:hypothetical protein ABU162_04350 [Paenibacillus thiaminolyticus]|uniref:hypothetical protein n=1 Tax=Paenibacillus thiaminolyticus TaxID=49283 RepID=UPI0035A61B94
MKNVMSRAWEIAREGFKKFGGQLKEYFAVALRMAWAEKKKGAKKMQVHKWVTQKGSTIELHAKHVTQQKWVTDWGQEMTKEVNFVMIYKLIINGKTYRGDRVTRVIVNGQAMLDTGDVVVHQGRKYKATVQLPQDVNQAVWGAYDAIEAAKSARKEAAWKSAEERRKLDIKNGLCPRCNSYCYGDCTAV